MSDATTTWGIGDYPLMARQLKPAALVAVDAASILPDERVLDVATGTGNAALLAAKRGGRVIGIDFEPALLEVAKKRAHEIGDATRWLNGELEQLPVPNECADVVLSVFGVMYAVDHAAAARELFRVTVPGGRVVLASWLPGSAMSAMGQVVGSYLPASPPTVSGPPSRWGDASALRTLLDDCGLHLTGLSIHNVPLRFPNAAAGAAFLIATAGHIISERERLIQAGRWDDLRRELTTFVEQRAEPRDDHLELRLDYLLAIAVKNSQP